MQFDFSRTCDRDSHGSIAHVANLFISMHFRLKLNVFIVVFQLVDFKPLNGQIGYASFPNKRIEPQPGSTDQLEQRRAVSHLRCAEVCNIYHIIIRLPKP